MSPTWFPPLPAAAMVIVASPRTEPIRWAVLKMPEARPAPRLPPPRDPAGDDGSRLTPALRAGEPPRSPIRCGRADRL